MSQLPRLISLVPKRFEDGGWTGVARFDWELRKIFPSLISLNTGWLHRWKLWRISRDYPDAIVITGNETSLLVPDRLRTIVVHHGCAQTHWDRDPHWRGRGARKFCRSQQKMYSRPNRWYVSPAQWTAQEFSRHYDVPLAPVLPAWVPPLARASDRRASGQRGRAGQAPNPGASDRRALDQRGSDPRTPDRRTPNQSADNPVVLGDWRTYNKGASLVEDLADHMPGIDFRLLSCTYDTRADAYAEADAYLCLSLSEGGSYSVADAESAALPLVTTNVGSYVEYEASEVIDWRDRDQLDVVAAALTRVLSGDRPASFFETWTRERCSEAWHDLVKEVASSGPREPLHA